ncbi:MAG: phosphoesterase, partial [Gammaproteobacteria bacterium]
MTMRRTAAINMLACVAIAVLLALVSAPRGGAQAARVKASPASLPAVRHVFVILLENQSFGVTFGKHSPAPYLAQTLPAQGALLTHYYGIGHASLDNYVALISGQAPNEQTQLDCPIVSEF